jgi:anthranilate synthase component II
MVTLLVIDNYDSFTYNLIQMFMPYSLRIKVFRSDKITLSQAVNFSPDYVLISPGPRSPSHAGISKDLIRLLYREVPILGVCLGMQCMNEVFGGFTDRAPFPMHGKTSRVFHDGLGVFKNVPSPLIVARYHSLMARFTSTELEIGAQSEEGVVMGMRHPEFPLHGVQFHPESFLTEKGELLVRNFLHLGPLNGEGGI